MNAIQTATVAIILAEIAAVQSGAKAFYLTHHEIACIAIEQAEAFEKTPAYRMYAHRVDAAGMFTFAMHKAGRELRAAKVAAYQATAAKAA